MAVFVPKSTALITGGASGVGLAVAKLCRKHGMKVAIVDNNVESLSKAKETLGSDDIETYQVDVSDRSAWNDLRSSVEDKFGQVDLLHLNAGIGLKGTWGDDDYFQKIFATNLFGVINGLNAFVPTFQKRPSSAPPSAIILTGSKQGITNPPGNAAYNASKSAVKTIAEHLSHDLRSTNTTVHLLVPGWTFTGLTGGGSLKEKPAGAWDPSQVADYLYTKMQEKKTYIICPDNDVDEEKDKKRMRWAVEDIIYERPALTRWRDEYKEEHEQWMQKTKI